MFAVRGVFRPIFRVLICGLAVLFAQTANGQGVFDMGSLTSTLSVDHVTQSEAARSSGVRSADLSARTMLHLGKRGSAKHSPRDTAFRVSPKIRKKTLARIVAQTAVNDPAGAKEMARIFASSDVIGEIGQAISPFGLKTDNVADAYTIYCMTAWQAAHRDNADFTPAAVASVRQQSANILMGTDAFVGADDGIKQELAEIYLVQAALIQAVADSGRTDPQLRAKLATAVRKGANASGLDLSAMTLTENGFAKARIR